MKADKTQPKLTKAQYETLRDIEFVRMPVSPHYEPAKKLVEKGLARWHEGSFVDCLEITDAGTIALSPSGSDAHVGVRPEGQHSTGETGWLIEQRNSRTGEFKALWWGLGDEHEDGFGWTKDSLRALRFARECDAQAYINETGWTEAKPTHHRWG